VLDEAIAVLLYDVERLQHVVLLYDLLCLNGERCNASIGESGFEEYGASIHVTISGLIYRLELTRWRAQSRWPRARSWPTSLREIDLRARRGRRATARRDKASPRRFLTLPVCLEVLWMKPIVD